MKATETTTANRPTAEALNDYLAAGGSVIVATYGTATQYTARHAGWFTEGKDGSLYVKSGRGRNCLSIGSRLLVAIRCSR